MTSAAQFLPPPPPALGSAEYAAAFNEVKSLGDTNSSTRTEDETLFSQFWADVPSHSVTPPGHWDEIAEHVSLQRHLNLEQNARLFGLLNIGLADAAINCWETKYIYNLWRPITAIRDPRASQINPATAADPNWTPLWNTPNFPAYTSGHATFSGAASVILTSLFGPDTHFTSGSDDMPGYSRSFTSFAQAADEAADSRLVGGIHYRFDNAAGLQAGRELGAYVSANFLRPRSSAAARVFFASSGVRAGPDDSGLLTLAPARSGTATPAATLSHTPPAFLFLFPLPDPDGTGPDRLPGPTPGGGPSLGRAGDAGQTGTPGRAADTKPGGRVFGALPDTASHGRAARSAWSPELDWDAAFLADVAMALQGQ